MQLDHVPLDELKVAVNNSRTHADSQVQQIAASITEFGFTNPLLVEFDPRFCDVIVKRWQDYTNRHATLESTGEIFAVVGEAEDAG